MKVLVGPNMMRLESELPALREENPDIEFVHCADREALADEMADAHIYMGWMNRDLFLAGKNLKWIQSPSSGINHYTTIPTRYRGSPASG